MDCMISRFRPLHRLYRFPTRTVRSQCHRSIWSQRFGKHSARGHGAEDRLQEELVQHPPAPFFELKLREWPVKVEGYTLDGTGDLVFQRPGHEEYLVVETKYLRLDSRNVRNKGRKKVKEQAFFYGDCFQLMNPDVHVKIATYTNIDGLVYLKK